MKSSSSSLSSSSGARRIERAVAMAVVASSPERRHVMQEAGSRGDDSAGARRTLPGALTGADATRLWRRHVSKRRSPAAAPRQRRLSLSPSAAASRPGRSGLPTAASCARRRQLGARDRRWALSVRCVSQAQRHPSLRGRQAREATRAAAMPPPWRLNSHPPVRRPCGGQRSATSRVSVSRAFAARADAQRCAGPWQREARQQGCRRRVRAREEGAPLRQRSLYPLAASHARACLRPARRPRASR
jgi:hypothetical protein